MVGKSPAMNQLRAALDRVAPTNSRVLIRGRAGSGKELVARVMHDNSQRKEGPFVVLNAAAMAPDRVEEELFGTEDRTGGPRKVGALEEAHGGTLYIDEVADMPLETQGKVLRVLVEQKFLRVGGAPKVAVDVRIISSTSRDLEREMRRAASARTSTTASTSCRCACRAWPSGARTFPMLIQYLRRPDRAAPRAWRRARSARTPSPCCRRTTGRATCASCATTSSG